MRGMQWTEETGADILMTNTAKDSRGENKLPSAEERATKDSSAKHDNGQNSGRSRRIMMTGNIEKGIRDFST